MLLFQITIVNVDMSKILPLRRLSMLSLLHQLAALQYRQILPHKMINAFTPVRIALQNKKNRDVPRKAVSKKFAM